MTERVAERESGRETERERERQRGRETERERDRLQEPGPALGAGLLSWAPPPSRPMWPQSAGVVAPAGDLSGRGSEL